MNYFDIFVAIIVISLRHDRAGLFDWAALQVARWCSGSRRRLFVLLVLQGAALSALIANDGAALTGIVLTVPILFATLCALALRLS